ncbi:H-NS family nucleoid-associated regulatory protein [Rhizobacter sp. SG703]|uniref:H-NS family nucleoid-associated regulatory protein n=1 Tax=Rhizobacter sp. SG703 TaxID=2587140 RepID=UPI001447E37E|nr:H-NS family nucleoid-associated regulatory protein [Rhizobacter sp. SG703]NKI94744.1 prefoldin subunit 5 [Rhizobacter sp. SG703]
MAKSLDQLRREAEKLQKQIAFLEQSENKIVEYVAQMRQAIKEAGFDVADVIKHLQEKKTRAPRGTAEKKVPESQDTNGAKPEAGVTYKHSSWPEPWTSAGKRAPKYVIATIKSGKTWKQLVQR